MTLNDKLQLISQIYFEEHEPSFSTDELFNQKLMYAKECTVFCRQHEISATVAGSDIFFSAKSGTCIENLEMEFGLEIDYL